MQKTSKFRRLLAGLLAVLMLSICIPAAAFAEGEKHEIKVTYTYVDEDNQIHYVTTNDGDNFDTLVVDSGEAKLDWTDVSQMLDIPEGYSFDESQTGIVDLSGETLNVKLVKKPAVVEVLVTYSYEHDGTIEYADKETVSLAVGTYSCKDLADSTLTVPDGYKLADENATVTVAENTETLNIPVVKEPAPVEVLVTYSYEHDGTIEYVGKETVALAVGTYSCKDLADGTLTVPSDYKLADENATVTVAENTETLNIRVVKKPAPVELFVTYSYEHDGTIEYVGKETVTLAVGTYNCKDLADSTLTVPNGYKLADENATVTVAENTETLNIRVVKEPAPVEVFVTYSYEHDGTIEYVGKETVTLAVGTYSCKDLADSTLTVPDGYKLADENVTVTVAENTETLNINVVKENTPVSMLVTYAYEHDGKVEYVGAKHTITLAVGTYCYKDLADNKTLNVPDGYKLADEKATFAVTKDTETLNVNVVKADVNQPADTTTNTPNTNKTNTTTATAAVASGDSNNAVVKASAPANNTTKILPQTGNQGVVSPVSFVVVLCAALAGAAVYLFAVRKKLN